MLMRIVVSEHCFGEGSLIPADENIRETAIAMEPVQLMCWTAKDLHE
jgi:hypothetical protein